MYGVDTCLHGQLDDTLLVDERLTYVVVALERIDAHPDGVVTAHALADSADHLEQKARPIFDRATPTIRAGVPGREELVDEVTVTGMQFDPVVTGALATGGGGGEEANDPEDVILVSDPVGEIRSRCHERRCLHGKLLCRDHH